MQLFGTYIQKQYKTGHFIPLAYFEDYIANKAGLDTCANMNVIRQLAHHVGATEIARGAAVDDIHRRALEIVLQDIKQQGFDLTVNHSVTLRTNIDRRYVVLHLDALDLPPHKGINQVIACLIMAFGSVSTHTGFHIGVIPSGIVSPWDTFAIVIPEAVMYEYVKSIAKRLLCTSEETNHEHLNTNGKILAQLMDILPTDEAEKS